MFRQGLCIGLFAVLIWCVAFASEAVGATLVPLRTASQALGGSVYWDGTVAVAHCNGRVVQVDPRTGMTTVDGYSRSGMLVTNLGGSMYVPQELIQELAGYEYEATDIPPPLTRIRVGERTWAVALARSDQDYLVPVSSDGVEELWIISNWDAALAGQLAARIENSLSQGTETRLEPEAAQLLLRSALVRAGEVRLATCSKIGECVIDFNARSAYNNMLNAVKAASQLNGTRLAPGAVFSFNGTLGPRTTEKGYLVGFAFAGQREVKAVGGGVCRTSTVVYGAVLDARLPVVERWPHSLPVDYAAPGRDATVSYGGADLKFRNNTGRTLFLETGGTVHRLYARIWVVDPVPATAPAPGILPETLPPLVAVGES